MVLGIVSVLALIFIFVVVIKILWILVSPKGWIRISKSVYSNPNVLSGVSFVFAAIVFYFLISAGIGIVEILAVSLFVGLLYAMGLARYGGKFLNIRHPERLLREQWFYALIWVVLVVWGVGYNS
jgi:hypothetical protein